MSGFVIPKVKWEVSLGSPISTATALTAAVTMMAMMKAELGDHDRRIAKLEASRIDDDRNTTDLRERISGRLSSLETSMNTVIATLRSISDRLDRNQTRSP